MKTGIIILSRYSSSRLPGKALKKINGKPLLGYIIDKLRSYFDHNEIIIATSNESSDDGIAELAVSFGVNLYRGSLNNVAQRFLEAAEAEKLDYAVRITGDSLFIDAALIKSVLATPDLEQFEILSNRKYKTYPIGQTVEVVDVKSFRKRFDLFNTDAHFEHVTEYHYENEENLKIKMHHVTNPDGVFRAVSLAVDSPEDFIQAEKAIKKLGASFYSATYRQVLEIYQMLNEAQGGGRLVK